MSNLKYFYLDLRLCHANHSCITQIAVLLSKISTTKKPPGSAPSTAEVVYVEIHVLDIATIYGQFHL